MQAAVETAAPGVTTLELTTFDIASGAVLKLSGTDGAVCVAETRLSGPNTRGAGNGNVPKAGVTTG